MYTITPTSPRPSPPRRSCCATRGDHDRSYLAPNRSNSGRGQGTRRGSRRPVQTVNRRFVIAALITICAACTAHAQSPVDGATDSQTPTTANTAQTPAKADPAAAKKPPEKAAKKAAKKAPPAKVDDTKADAPPPPPKSKLEPPTYFLFDAGYSGFQVSGSMNKFRK